VTEARPQTRYVSVGETDVAYQVLGEGPQDLLFFSPVGGNIDLVWLSPDWSRFFIRLASFCRLILFDRRGTGQSDRVARNTMPTWEDLSEDVGAVLDAIGATQPVIMTLAETGPMAVLFAATHPDRVGGLALLNSYARFLVAEDYPMGVSDAAIDWFREVRPEQLGQAVSCVNAFCVSVGGRWTGESSNTYPGDTYVSTDGGADWLPMQISTPYSLTAVSCASTVECVAVGGNFPNSTPGAIMHYGP